MWHASTTDDAEAYGYAGCEPFPEGDDYDPMYSGPDDYSWREAMFDAMPYGYGLFKWEDRPERQKYSPRIAEWAERYWRHLCDTCPEYRINPRMEPEAEEWKHVAQRAEWDARQKLFERWCVWARKVTTSNRKRRK